MVRRCCATLVCILVVGWTSARAQEEQSKPKEQKLKETIVKEKQPQAPLRVKATTATKTDVPLRDLPQSVQVIPRWIMDEQGDLSLREVIELNVPGVGFDTANNTKDKFILRGLGSQLFRDGLREVSSPRLNLSDVERVEILKGPASVLYGRAEAGAMINIISKMPVWETMYNFSLTAQNFSGSRNEGYADLGGLYDNATVSADIGGAIIKDKLAYRLTAYLDDSDGWRDYIREDTRDLAFAMEWRLTDRVTFALRTAFYDRDQVTDRGLMGRDGKYPAEFSTFYGSRGTTSATDQFLVEPRLEFKINDRLRLRNIFRYTIHDKEEVSLRSRRVEDNFIGAFGGTAGKDGVYESVEREQRQIDEDYDWFTEQFEIIGTFFLGDVKNDFLLGFETTIITGTRQDFRLRDSGNVTDALFHTSWFEPQANVRTIDANINHALASGKRDVDFTDRYYGAYLQDMITFSEKWKLLGGVRLDRYDEELENPYKTVNPEQDVLENVVSWRAGLVFQPVKQTSFYALASRGFKPTGGVYSSNIERDDGKDFEPEQNILYEVGNKTTFLDERLAVTFSLYEGTRKNFTTTDPDTGETKQVGEQRTRGTELILDGMVTTNWSLMASYAHTDAKYIKRFSRGEDLAGKTPAFVPKNTFGLWTSYNFNGRFKVPLKLGGGVRWVAKRWQEDANESEFDSYTVTDLFAEYEFNQHASLRMNVKNVFDEEYFISGTGYGDYAMPGDPLSAELTLNVKF